MKHNKYYFKSLGSKVHNNLFPHSFRALIIGASGYGKTTLLMRLLLEDDLLNYDKLYVFAKSLYQPEYEILKSGLENNLPKQDIRRIMNSEEYINKADINFDELAEAMQELNVENEKDPSEIECEFHETGENIPDPATIDRSIRNVIVFDDVMTDKKQTPAENYYTRGRSANCDCIYLSQNYTHLPLHTIRSNSNFMIFFKSSPLVVEQIHRNFSSVDMNIDEWKQLCKDAWSKKYGYIVIDLSRDYESGNKYRKQLELVL